MSSDSTLTPSACAPEITALELLGLLIWRHQHPGRPVPRLLCSTPEQLEALRSQARTLVAAFQDDERAAATARAAGDARAFFVCR